MEKIKQKVLEMCPWSFEKQLIVLKEFEGELVPRDIVMKHCPFWVQIFNLPLKSRTKETGRAIGSTLGEVLDIDVSESGVHWGRLLRVRVNVDITKKLIRGKKINIEGGENRWVIFKYERLPNFCYRCGMLDHAIKEWLEGPVVKEGEEEGSLQYRAWLKGDPWKRYGGDPAQFGQGRGQVHRQRNNENVAVKAVEPIRVVGAEQWKGENGEQALSLSDVNHNALGEFVQSSDSQRELGKGLHDLGKVNGRLEKAEEKEATLGDDSLGFPSAQPDIKMAMQWEKAEADKTEAPFKFKLAPNETPTQPGLEETILGEELGPMAMSYDENVGWVAEKIGPKYKHWKRLAREIKPDAPKKSKSPTKQKRECPTPLAEIDPNALELKRRRGKNKQVVSVDGNTMDGSEAVAARQHRQAQ